MKTFIPMVASLIALLASVVIRAEPEIHNAEIDVFLRPGNDELWCISVEPQRLEIFDTYTLQPLRSYNLTGNPIVLAFDETGDHVYVVANVPDENRAYVACYETDDFQLLSEAPLSGIACGVCVHENGYVYATSQDPMLEGYIQKFTPVSLGLAASADTQSWPSAICTCPSNGLIYVGGTDEFDGDGVTDREVYSKVLIYDPLDLALAGEIHAGLHHSLFISTDSLLVIENFGCASYDPEFQHLLKGLTIVETDTENVLLDWQVYPDVLRGSCLEPVSRKWFGCTFSSTELTGSELWMICDLANPLPQSLGVFPDSRVTRMVAFPFGGDQIRLVGIDSQSENLFVHDVPANAPPEAAFNPVPPCGQAPLEVRASEIVTENTFVFLRPSENEIWAISSELTSLHVYDSVTIQLLRSEPIIGHAAGLAFDAQGDFVYLLAAVPDEKRAYLGRFAADSFTPSGEAAVSGVPLSICVDDSGNVYVTSQSPSVAEGYVQKFSGASLQLLASATVESWPGAIAFSRDTGLLYVGSLDEHDGDGVLEPEVYSKVLALKTSDLSYNSEIHAGLHHRLIVADAGMLMIESTGVASRPGYENLCKGLTVVNAESGDVVLDWQVYPNVVRASCFEPLSGKWFGCTFSSTELTGSELWMICDLANPLPQSLGVFPDSRVTRMVAFPFGGDQIRLVGIDSQNENLFVHDVPANAPPESAFTPVPPAGQAPLTVDFLNYSSDCDGDIVEIRADWNGDGNTDETFQGSPGTIEHEFVDPGIYEVKLTVVDDDGATDDWEASIPVIE